MNIFCDGSGWDGKETKYCIVTDEDPRGKIYRFPEKHTNNEMEYWAVLHGMMIAENGDTIYTDSQLVVNQLNNIWEINFYHLKHLNDEVVKEWKKKPDVTVEWIRRNRNPAGKRLEKFIEKSKR